MSALPTNQTEWQTWIDTVFPDQVNCRITAETEDEEIDFSAVGITVIGMNGTLPALLFWEPGSSKDFYLVATALKVRQTSQHPLIQLTDKSGTVWQFWPRPAQGNSEAQKATERGMALTSASAYTKSGETS